MIYKLIFVIALQLFAYSACAIQMPDTPFIYSEGEAEREVQPNLVDFTFYIKTFDENPDKAFKDLQKQSLELKELFNKIDISEENIESYDIDKTTVRETDDNGRQLKILGYDVQQKFNLRLSDLNKYGLLMNKLVSLKNVSDFYSTFDVVERKDIEQQLTIDACADAKTKAEVMANSTGGQLGSVLAVSEKSFGSIEDAFGLSSSNDRLDRMFKKSAYKGDSITFIPSSIKIKKRVNAIYKLSEK
ncbi:hypothetical protein CWO84_11715 [Methylomonas sp. Kb3]|uniref:SIMPL domain-containing protein n=1 Tax=Methylomonas sp. Kb3 TaxID=1611544 RepID=UPI000C3318BB|nr:SIMPL domain-containing protein [Methylomonas sp. Kb3]PKD40252.1 hypothetical protein CWO84_11715 [Methylomonas sp. Kb3]